MLVRKTPDPPALSLAPSRLYARAFQCALEGAAAPEEEGHQVVPPVLSYVRWLVHGLTPDEHTVPGQVGTDVGAVGQYPDDRVPGLQHLQQGAWLGISLAEKEKVEGHFPGDDAQVAVGVSNADAIGTLGPLAFPEQPSGLRGNGGHLLACQYHFDYLMIV